MVSIRLAATVRWDPLGVRIGGRELTRCLIIIDRARCSGPIISFSRFRGLSRDHRDPSQFSRIVSHTPLPSFPPSLLPGYAPLMLPFLPCPLSVRPHTQGRARPPALLCPLSGMEDFPPLFNTRIGATDGEKNRVLFRFAQPQTD